MARILQVCNNDFYLMHFLAPLVRRLREYGHEVECVCDGHDIDVAKLGGPIKVHQIRFPVSNSLGGFYGCIQELRGILRAGSYDCVDSHNRSASIVGRIATWLEGVSLNLYTAHGYYFHDDQAPVAHFATVGLEAVLARLTDYTLSQSQEDARFMLAKGHLVPGSIEVIGNGIDTRRFTPVLARDREQLEKELGLRPGRFRVVSTGRIVRAKGFTDVLRAFSTLRQAGAECEFLIVGGNIARDIEPYQEQFFALARELGVFDDVVVTGITPHVERYLAASDVFVLASYREGLPRAMLEAMAAGLPVVVTNIRGCREAVADDVDGYLFAPRDVDRLSSLLRKLHADPQLRSRLGSAARQKAQASFDERDYVERQVQAMNRLLGAPHTASDVREGMVAAQ